MMHITHKIERTVVAIGTIVATSSLVVFVFLLVHTNATNIDDISGSMGLKAAVGSVALISIIAVWSLQQEYVLVNGLKNQVRQLLWKEDMDVLLINDDQHALITYEGGVYCVLVTCLNSLEQTLYVVHEYSVDIYLKESLQVQLLAGINDNSMKTDESLRLNLGVMLYKREMSVLIKAMEQHWKLPTPL
jgi:hypothetical protein